MIPLQLILILFLYDIMHSRYLKVQIIFSYFKQFNIFKNELIHSDKHIKIKQIQCNIVYSESILQV